MKASKLSVAAKGDCITEVCTGKLIQVEILLVSSEEMKAVQKKDGWVFNWKQEFKNERRQLYKLTVVGDSTIQGL